MKKILLLFLVLFYGLDSYAQLEAGSVAPDWTMTDLNGNTHSLYNYLNEDKVVFLIFSATWCGPCWNYHNATAMKDFYAAYGPDGTDEAMVFFIEGDVSTTIADLEGTGGNTWGNWINGTPFPIINMPNSSIANAYRINYFPTIYGVYPNRFITEVGTASLSGLTSFFNGRKLATNPVEISLLDYEGARVACGGEADVKIKVQNYGTAPLTILNMNFINKNTGDSIKSIRWEGNLAKYDFINLGDVIEVSEKTDLIIEVYAPGTESEEIVRMEISLFPEPEYFVPSIIARFIVRTDGNAHQNRFEVRDSKGTIVIQEKNLENNKTYEFTRNLRNNECYSFTVFDSAGNGFTGNGFFRIQDNQGNVIYEGKEFGYEETVAFQRGTVSSVKNIAQYVENLLLYPVPANENLRVSFYSKVSSDYTFAIRSLHGNLIYESGIETALKGELVNRNLNTSDFPSGMYILTITDSERGIISKPFLVQK